MFKNDDIPKKITEVYYFPKEKVSNFLPIDEILFFFFFSVI